MQFSLDHDMLKDCKVKLSGRKLYWVVGGAGSGKTTVCQALVSKYDLSLYEMDAHVYGTYHSRFTVKDHPVNKAWSASPNGLEWLLDMSWEEFDCFNRAALVEYLHLLCEDIGDMPAKARLLVDGGIINTSILAMALPADQIVCLTGPQKTSAEVWQADADRQSMLDMVRELPHPDEAVRKFLEFDEKITNAILNECRASNIKVLSRSINESIEEVADRVAQTLKIC